MFNILSSNSDKKNKKEQTMSNEAKEARDLFNLGRFPVVTTQTIENRPIAKVLGLVCCRGFDSEEAFFGMAAMAVKKGAQAIIGYNENIAFHPDGSKYFSCFGTAIMFEREGRMDFIGDKKTIKEALNKIPTAPPPNQNYTPGMQIPQGEHVHFSPNGYNLSQQEGLPLEDFEMENFQHDDLTHMAQPEKIENKYPSQPSEEDDPVLQRLLASKKRQANAQGWQ